ncbi:putative hydantoin racemase [Azorhizobium caulinodans ORS 571]|uniref:Putative hydantoin racemase n=1 Tax=Azorhizobium caulinodans (strain ATCC 43989 / DSM 5975 / JCM 20966 / LMG 6465 / NBRC 14845 / NCIMB 13405 / ORS 571) TaxID=438753 RepID=A8I2M9_AZOC5|nr:aspartate/glutamate racemase family protein [Azorhizobium caulinodans]BAF87901.1 putative hydantoin racemase [Azorhizobium caulinodans ORS 571]
MSQPHILLINPNSSPATTDMMCAIAERAAGERVAIVCATATRSPAMIVTVPELEASAAEVVELGAAHGENCLGIIVSAYGDPGLDALRAQVDVPVVGICEASMLAAARGGRRFSVATVTPDLLDHIAAKAEALGLGGLYAGARCSDGDARALAGNAEALDRTLGELVRLSIEDDGAEAVIIGGGPLGAAADRLRPLFPVPVLGPIPCAVEHLLDRAA